MGSRLKFRMAEQLNARCLGSRILGQSFWGTGTLWESVGRSSVPTEPPGGIQVAKLPAEQKWGQGGTGATAHVQLFVQTPKGDFVH